MNIQDFMDKKNLTTTKMKCYLREKIRQLLMYESRMQLWEKNR
jgi:hypothetical protein